MNFEKKRFGMKIRTKTIGSRPRAWAARSKRRREGRLEFLEDRTLLTGPQASIESVAIVLGTPGPTSISGALNPGNELVAYRIDGTAGESLQFHSVSTTSTNGGWSLLNPGGQTVASATLGSDFSADLPGTGPYYLELQGNMADEIDYRFQVTDITASPPLASQGFDTPQSGTLDSAASATYTFQSPGGQAVFFQDQGFQGGNYAQLTDPNGRTVFATYPVYNGLTSPFLLATPGTYTLTITNYNGSTAAYGFDMVSLADEATPITLGPTQTITGTLDPGDGVAVYDFQGAAGQRVFLNTVSASGAAGNLLLMKPDGSLALNLGLSAQADPLTLTQSGTYYLIASARPPRPSITPSA